MGFLSGLFHSRDKPTNSTNGSAYRFLFDGSNSVKFVNERSAMQMTAVYACVRILSESIAGLPVHIYKYTDSGSKEKAITHPLYRLIHDEPNPEITSFVFRETLMTHLLLYGNAYAQIIRNGKGEVIALYPLMANRMSVDRDDKFQTHLLNHYIFILYRQCVIFFILHQKVKLTKIPEIRHFSAFIYLSLTANRPSRLCFR